MNLPVSAIERARERFDESVVRETPVETSGTEQTEWIVAAIQNAGFPVTRVN
ncbi:hypothetical protein [Halostagnicola sp. A56]|uniref:hypothetical protein n=1 Tax=Halostagnicola sp. A56 TaxID=1495067 RepID=UPI0012E1E8EB|nr:hypothetical protein [Halostagnicola sp. A56]